MTFEELAQYLEKLEGTSSRLKMTEILAEMFARTTPAEARLAAYLIGGKLGPAYRSPDFGMADKIMVRAIAGAFQVSAEEVTEVFKKEGDLGRTAEEYKYHKPGRKQPINSNLQIQYVYKKLLEIAEAGGKGSQEEKIKLVGGLVSELGPVAAKYAVKMMLGKLRSGFSDMTVLDSLSWMLTGNKKLRPEMERIYNVRADLGEVAEIIKKLKHPEDLREIRIDPEIGTPVLMAKAERAATAQEIFDRLGKCAAEYKLDGLRIQAHVSQNGVKLYTRGLEEMSEAFADISKGLAKQMKEESIVEGETIGVDEKGKFLDFQQTMQRKRKYSVEEMSGKVPLRIYLFDVLAVSGKNVMDKPNWERRKILEGLVGKGDIAVLINRVEVDSAEKLDEFFKKALAEGTEGIVAKKLDGPYQAGNRNFNWIKLKSVLDSVDVVVMGYTTGQGKRTEFGVGEFLVGVYDPKTDRYLTTTKVGSGATDEEWVKLRKLMEKHTAKEKPANYVTAKQYTPDYWIEPEMVLEIQANEITVSPAHSAGYALRFPRLVSIREKRPEEATTVAELTKLYKMQKQMR